MLKLLILSTFLFTSYISFSQAFIDFGGGISKVRPSDKVPECIVPTMKISTGYQFGNIVAEAMAQPSLSNLVNTPMYLGAKVGYNIRGFIPSVGMLYNYCNSDDVSMNRWEVGYGLKYQFPLNENGGLFAEALYTKSSYSITTGFNIQF